MEGAKRFLPDESVALLICDPPFGLDESQFDQHYSRDKSQVIKGYVEAPANPEGYSQFSKDWLA